jgi:MHS family proline/betaine transporter-like MFS transporter
MANNRNIIISGIIGNILEQYDNIVFGFLATFISVAFFAHGNAMDNLLSVFYVFSVGFAMRPLGSLFFGYISDCFGRKKTLTACMVTIGLSTTLIGLLPTYASIGLLSTILLIACRIFQGLAVGGEYISSVAFLFEHAPKNRRGFIGSFAAFGINCGNLAASFICCFIIYAMSHGILPSNAWRIPFLLTIAGIPIGNWIRHRNSETLPFIRENSNERSTGFKTHLKRAFQAAFNNKSHLLVMIALSAVGTCATYLIYLYAPLHSALFRHLSSWKIMAINVFSLLILVILIPLFGRLSDSFSREKMILIACMLLTILAYPFFWVATYGDITSFLILQVAITIAVAIFHSIAPTIFVELIPVKFRCTIGGVVYNVSSGLFGVSAPIIALLLIKHTHNYASPALYLMGLSVLCMMVMGRYQLKRL